jgi:mono/diheme cytochrome c family protein
MRVSTAISTAFLALALLLALGASAKTGGNKDSATSTTTTAANSSQDENLHLEGEKRFRSNCGRCHAAPPKFPSRMMATIVRHMRVRANITDDDMRLILRYMAE